MTREEKIAIIRRELDRSRSDLAHSVAERETRQRFSDRPPIEQAGEYHLEYRTTETNFVTELRNSEHRESDWSGWEDWLAARLKREREVTYAGVGSAIAEMLKEERDEYKKELSAEVRQLRIELANLEATLSELRSLMAAERGQVIDTPNPLAPRRAN
jgi:hypothetical protein